MELEFQIVSCTSKVDDLQKRVLELEGMMRFFILTMTRFIWMIIIVIIIIVVHPTILLDVQASFDDFLLLF